MFVDVSSLALAVKTAFSRRWYTPRRLGFTLLCLLVMGVFYLIKVEKLRHRKNSRIRTSTRWRNSE